MGRVSLLFSTDKPMSSANALRVDPVGREWDSWSNNIAKQSTKRVGDMGQP